MAFMDLCQEVWHAWQRPNWLRQWAQIQLGQSLPQHWMAKRCRIGCPWNFLGRLVMGLLWPFLVTLFWSFFLAWFLVTFMVFMAATLAIGVFMAATLAIGVFMAATLGIASGGPVYGVASGSKWLRQKIEFTWTCHDMAVQNTNLPKWHWTTAWTGQGG